MTSVGSRNESDQAGAWSEPRQVRTQEQYKQPRSARSPNVSPTGDIEEAIDELSRHSPLAALACSPPHRPDRRLTCGFCGGAGSGEPPTRAVRQLQYGQRVSVSNPAQTWRQPSPASSWPCAAIRLSPPSTVSDAPVTYAERGEARKAIKEATSFT
jgi:hypothetical protein